MKIPSALTRLAFVASLALAAAGCNTVNTVMPANPEGLDKPVADKRVITSGSLNDIAYVARVSESTVSGDIKRVQFLLHNTSTAAKQVDIKIQWMDRTGIAITSPEPIWEPVSIEGGEFKPVTETAPSPNATDWILSIEASNRRSPGPL